MPSSIMDPAASPVRRSGVRRVNNVPVLILGGAVAIFLAIMAYVAAGRAAQGEGSRDDGAVRSALPIAKDITGGYEAGMVPAAASGASSTNAQTGSRPTSGASSGTGGRDARSGLPPLPIASASLGDRFPKPPRPPRLGGHDALLPPRSADENAPEPSGERPPEGAVQSAENDEEHELARMKFEMFKQAIRAPSAVKSDRAESEARSDGGKLAQVRAQLAAAQARSGGDYIEKLRELQESGLIPAGDGNANGAEHKGGDAYSQFAGGSDEDRWALGSQQQAPSTRYELRAGAVIPATLQTGINSDLPGQITAIVAQDVRDTATGKYVLIPQASRLVGTYGADVKYGQERVLVAWQRVVWPDGKVLDIGAMPDSDGAGYAGFKDQVDTHFWRMFAGSLLLSGITGGIAMSQDATVDKNGPPTFSGAMSQALGQQMGQLIEEYIRKQMNVAPTIEIRPGYRFNVQVTKDLTFSGPYRAFDYQRSISDGTQTFRLQKE
jgi:type IV secretion system protein VirB10